MASQALQEPDRAELSACRTSKHMRTSLGFFPTSGSTRPQGNLEWDLYKDANKRVIQWLKEQKLTASNVRAHFDKVHHFVKQEAEGLWSIVEPKALDMLPSRDACYAYVYACVYAAMGSYEHFAASRRAKATKQ